MSRQVPESICPSCGSPDPTRTRIRSGLYRHLKRPCLDPWHQVTPAPRRCPVAPEGKSLPWHVHDDWYEAELAALREENDRLTTTLEMLAPIQPKALRYIRDNGFVFDDIGKEPGNWKHLAFSLYTELCEVDAFVRAALATPQEER